MVHDAGLLLLLCEQFLQFLAILPALDFKSKQFFGVESYPMHLLIASNCSIFSRPMIKKQTKAHDVINEANTRTIPRRVSISLAKTEKNPATIAIIAIKMHAYITLLTNNLLIKPF